MRRWGIILILIGLFVIAYPQIKHVYEDVQQRQLLASLNEIPDASDALVQEQMQLAYPDLSANGSSQPAGNPANAVHSVPALNNASDEASEQQASGNADGAALIVKKSGTGAIGIVEIPKIKVKLPILEGASSANLNRGAAHLTGTSNFGTQGNAVVAAHHSYKYGRMFNRLGEIAIGDMITIQTGKQLLSYKVTVTTIVTPTEISVLKQPKNGQFLTLITCNSDGSHRIIVKAERQ